MIKPYNKLFKCRRPPPSAATQGLRYMARKFSPVYLLLLLLCAAANAKDDARCVRQHFVEIDGLLPGLHETVLKSQKVFLGKESIAGEDDGGSYTGHKFIFSNYQVVTVRGTIDSIHITSPELLWAHGIHLGSDRDSIDGSLSFAEVFRGHNNSQYSVCSDVGDIYAVLQYEESKLESIEVVIERP